MFGSLFGPARGLVVSASASVLVGRAFDSRPGHTNTNGKLVLHPSDTQNTKTNQKLYELSRGATRPL